MSVGEFCNREVVVTERTTNIVKVAQIMRQQHVGDVIIVDSTSGVTKPVGIITDRDIVLELIACEVPLHTVTAGDVMSYDLMTAREHDGVWDTIRRMRGAGIRRVPVVNDEGGLEGILAVDDLLELLADELAMLAKVPEREVKKEQEQRK